MTGTFIKRKKLGHRDRYTRKKDNVKRHREKEAISELRSEVWTRSFPHFPQKELTLPTNALISDFGLPER